MVKLPTDAACYKWPILAVWSIQHLEMSHSNVSVMYVMLAKQSYKTPMAGTLQHADYQQYSCA